MRSDQWWWQPWAWLWSDLERDRLGRRLGFVALVTWAGPWGIMGVVVFRTLGQGILGMMGSLVAALGIILGGQAYRIRQARQHGWQTMFWEPTSWAVRRLTERTVWGDPAHWAGVPHWERHTIERRWPNAPAFVQARRQEWQALVRLGSGSEVPSGVLVSHTFSTIGSVPPGWRHQGTPLSGLARREGRALSRTQQRMFGQIIARRGPDVCDPQSWQVVTVPLIHGLTDALQPDYTHFNESGSDR